ncbi:5-epiaristolochene 1,3-dihydroxylase [Glycine max]|nr:5-epiaristolochene 1,3-dihydroxylase [Glycine max]
MVKISRVMKNTQAEVKETLRLHPPIPLLVPTECGQTCDIQGYKIRAKSKVVINTWAIGRNPNYWTIHTAKASNHSIQDMLYTYADTNSRILDKKLVDLSAQ